MRLVHGNNASIQKLIKEFREFWRIKSLGPDDENTEDSPPAQTEAREPMEIDQKSPDLNNPSTSETPNKGSVLFSKRQLDMKIKSIAVYEKRDSYKKSCWYVNQTVLEEHKLTDLAVPCEWQWITRPNVPKLEGTPKSGRKTPTQGGTPTRANIQQFTVKMTPEQFAQMMPKPESKTSSPVTPTRANIQQFIVKMAPEQLAKTVPKVEPKVSSPRPLNPLQQMLFRTPDVTPSLSQVSSVSSIPKSVFEQPDGAVPSTSGTPPKTTSLFQRMILDAKQAHYQKKEVGSSCDINNDGGTEDEDCMIVDEEGPTLPLVAPKGQPTLFSLLKKTVVK